MDIINKDNGNDWRKQNALLHMHDNHKFQSVYTRHSEPVIEQYKANQDLADLIIFLACCAVLGVAAIAAVPFWPALRACFV